MKRINACLGTCGNVSERTVFDRRTNKVYHSCQSMVTSNKLVEFWKELYASGKKVITEKYLSDLNLEALGVFWMDDGCVVKASNVGLLATYCDEQQAKVIGSWIHDLTKTNPKPYIDRGSYRLRITRSEMPSFIYAIKPYILPEMSRKVTLHFKNRTKSSILYAASLNLSYWQEDDKKARAQNEF